MIRLVSAAAEEETHNPLVPPVAELVLGSIAFLIVLFLLGRVLIPRITKALEERTDAIEGGIARAEAAQVEAAAVLEEYRTQLAAARQEAALLREQAKEEGAAIIAEMREQAQAEANRITAAASAQIDAERRTASVALQAEAGRWATELASRIVGEALNDSALQSRVVDRFLADLEAAPAGSGGASPGREA
jgi:F-type H+-transporting ATPase subunit b